MERAGTADLMTEHQEYVGREAHEGMWGGNAGSVRFSNGSVVLASNSDEPEDRLGGMPGSIRSPSAAEEEVAHLRQALAAQERLIEKQGADLQRQKEMLAEKERSRRRRGSGSSVGSGDREGAERERGSAWSRERSKGPCTLQQQREQQSALQGPGDLFRGRSLCSLKSQLFESELGGGLHCARRIDERTASAHLRRSLAEMEKRLEKAEEREAQLVQEKQALLNLLSARTERSSRSSERAERESFSASACASGRGRDKDSRPHTKEEKVDEDKETEEKPDPPPAWRLSLNSPLSRQSISVKEIERLSTEARMSLAAAGAPPIVLPSLVSEGEQTVQSASGPGKRRATDGTRTADTPSEACDPARAVGGSHGPLRKTVTLSLNDNAPVFTATRTMCTPAEAEDANRTASKKKGKKKSLLATDNENGMGTRQSQTGAQITLGGAQTQAAPHSRGASLALPSAPRPGRISPSLQQELIGHVEALNAEHSMWGWKLSALEDENMELKNHLAVALHLLIEGDEREKERQKLDQQREKQKEKEGGGKNRRASSASASSRGKETKRPKDKIPAAPLAPLLNNLSENLRETLRFIAGRNELRSVNPHAGSNSLSNYDRHEGLPSRSFSLKAQPQNFNSLPPNGHHPYGHMPRAPPAYLSLFAPSPRDCRPQGQRSTFIRPSSAPLYPRHFRVPVSPPSPIFSLSPPQALRGDMPWPPMRASAQSFPGSPVPLSALALQEAMSGSNSPFRGQRQLTNRIVAPRAPPMLFQRPAGRRRTQSRETSRMEICGPFPPPFPLAYCWDFPQNQFENKTSNSINEDRHVHPPQPPPEGNRFSPPPRPHSSMQSRPPHQHSRDFPSPPPSFPSVSRHDFPLQVLTPPCSVVPLQSAGILSPPAQLPLTQTPHNPIHTTTTPPLHPFLQDVITLLPTLPVKGPGSPAMATQGNSSPPFSLQAPGSPKLALQDPGIPDSPVTGPSNPVLPPQGHGSPTFAVYAQGPPGPSLPAQGPGSPTKQAQGPGSPIAMVPANALEAYPPSPVLPPGMGALPCPLQAMPFDVRVLIPPPSLPRPPPANRSPSPVFALPPPPPPRPLFFPVKQPGADLSKTPLNPRWSLSPVRGVYAHEIRRGPPGETLSTSLGTLGGVGLGRVSGGMGTGEEGEMRSWDEAVTLPPPEGLSGDMDRLPVGVATATQGGGGVQKNGPLAEGLEDIRAFGLFHKLKLPSP